MSHQSIEQTIYAYYQSAEGIALPMYVRQHHAADYEQTYTPRFVYTGGIDQADLEQVRKEVARNVRVIEHNGRYYEITTANGDAPGDQYMLHISTYSSS